MTQFFVERAGDEYGNTAHGHVVIEAEVTPDSYNPDMKHLVVIAPPEFKAKWSSVLMDNFGGWMETDGPARYITGEEWETLTGQKRL